MLQANIMIASEASIMASLVSISVCCTVYQTRVSPARRRRELPSAAIHCGELKDPSLGMQSARGRIQESTTMLRLAHPLLPDQSLQPERHQKEAEK